MLKTIKNLIHIHIKAVFNLIKHDGVEHAGYMAFISLLSFFPCLMFLMSVASFIGKSEHGRELIYLLVNHLPSDLIQAIKPRIDEILTFPPSSLLTISIIGIVWTSSSIVEGLRTILNRIYHVSSPPAYIWRRLLSIFQFFIITGLLLFSMFVLVFLPEIYKEIEHVTHLKPIIDLFNQLSVGILAPVWDNARHLTFVITLFATVVLLYYGIPNLSLKVRTLIPGAMIVVILWMLSGHLLSKYISSFTQINLVYGSVAGFIITLLFFYIIHLIFIFGAEINILLTKPKKAINH